MKDDFDKLREIATTSHNDIDLHVACALVNKLTLLIHNLEFSEHNFAYYEFLKILGSNQKMFFPLLALNNRNNLNSISGIKVCDDSYRISNELKISLEETMHQYDSILDDIDEGSFYVDKKYAQSVNDVVYNSALFYFDAIQETEYFALNTKEIANVIVLLSLIRLGAIGKKCPEIAYAKYSSFTQKIDYLGDPQLARDMAEDIMKSSEIDDIKYCGAIAKFELSVKQKRAFEAMVLANFAIQSMQGLSSVKKHFYNSFFLSLMNLYRDMNLTKYAKIIFEDIVKKLDTNNYEKNRSYHSYLCCLLLDKDEQVCSKTREYLSLNLELILNDGQPAAAPWYSLLTNIFKIYPDYKNDLSHFYDVFKRMLPDDRVELVDLSIGNTENIIKSLEFKINSIYKSRRVNDIGMQLKSAWPIIHSSVEQGLHDQNFNALSLAILAKSTPIEPESENFIDNKRVLNPEDKLTPNDFSSSYRYQLTSFVRKHKNLLMLDEHDDEIYALFASGKETRVIRNLGKLKEIIAWSRNHLPKISFDEFRTIGKHREDFYSYWQEETNQILNTLPLLNLDIECSCEEFYVLPTNQLLALPTNLIRKSNGELIYQDNYISTVFPQSLYKDKHVNCKNNLNISINYFDEEDLSIIYTLGSIEDNVQDISVYSSGNLDETKIAFFIGHGARVEQKFAFVKTGENSFILADELAHLHGGADIVVLFICHSGFSNEMLASTDSYSIAKEFLSYGVKHVIAPSWPLNTCLTGPWTKVFLDSLHSGENVNKASYNANMALKQKFKSLSAWACLQHFQG